MGVVHENWEPFGVVPHLIVSQNLLGICFEATTFAVPEIIKFKVWSRDWVDVVIIDMVDDQVSPYQVSTEYHQCLFDNRLLKTFCRNFYENYSPETRSNFAFEIDCSQTKSNFGRIWFLCTIWIIWDLRYIWGARYWAEMLTDVPTMKFMWHGRSSDKE